MQSLPRPTRARTRLTVALAAAALAIATSGAAQTGAPPMAPPTPGPNQDLARQHLTAARNALSDLTQLPAAGQLAGNPRRLVQQIITDFNAMLTINAGWHASYERVDATLDELLAPPAPEPAAATTGAVGTSGASAGGERHRSGHPRQAPGVPRASRSVRRRGERQRGVGSTGPLDAAARRARGTGRTGLAPPRRRPSTIGRTRRPRRRRTPETIKRSPASRGMCCCTSKRSRSSSAPRTRPRKRRLPRPAAPSSRRETASGSTKTTITGPDVTLNNEQLAQITSAPQGHPAAARTKVAGREPRHFRHAMLRFFVGA